MNNKYLHIFFPKDNSIMALYNLKETKKYSILEQKNIFFFVDLCTLTYNNMFFLLLNE